MTSLTWGHININVTDLDRSVAFYQLLGFTIMIPGIPYVGLSQSPVGAVDADAARALDLADGTTGRACILQLADGFPKLDLTELHTNGPGRPLSNADIGIVRLCLATSDLTATWTRLSDAGVTFLSSPTSCRDGMADIAVCVDPDGTRIELIEVHIDRWRTIRA